MRFTKNTERIQEVFEHERKKANSAKDGERLSKYDRLSYFPWNYYGRPSKEDTRYYEASVLDLMGSDFTFNRWAQDRKSKGDSAYVLNIMGPPDLITNLDVVDKEVALTLVDMRTETEKKAGGDKKDVIECDVFSPATWDRLHSYMEVRNMFYFDLIFSRPLAPIAHAGLDKHFEQKRSYEYLAWYYKTLRRLYALLHSKQGLLLVEVPVLTVLERNKHFFIAQFITQLRQRGVEAAFSQTEYITMLKIIKREESIPVFPKIDLQREAS